MERASGIVVFLLGMVILWQVRHLSIGSLRAPGPGFFPTLLAAILIILSLFLIIPGGKKGSERQSFSSRSLSRVFMVFVALLSYFFFLEYLGFALVGFLFIAFFFVTIVRQRWYIALFTAFISIALAYVLFEILLKSNLPKGVFGF